MHRNSYEYKITSVLSGGPATIDEIIERLVESEWRNIPTTHQLVNILPRSRAFIKVGTKPQRRVGYGSYRVDVWDLVSSHND